MVAMLIATQRNRNGINMYTPNDKNDAQKDTKPKSPEVVRHVSKDQCCIENMAPAITFMKLWSMRKY